MPMFSSVQEAQSEFTNGNLFVGDRRLQSVLWYAVYAFNHLVLTDDGKTTMTGVIFKFRLGADKLPLHFLLGFFVSNVVSRWWSQAQLLQKCYPDKIVAKLFALLEKNDEHKVLCQKLIRWLNLECVLAWRQISERVKKRFPTDRHLVESGLMTEDEYQLFSRTQAPFGKYTVPAIWSANQLKRCEKDIDTFVYQAIVAEYLNYEQNMRQLLYYDWMKLPILYAQVCTLTTYAYMLLIVLGGQPKLDTVTSKKIEEFHLHFPLFHTLELIFYIAWLKVGIYLSCPYGDDDDDFELNYMLDRNLYMTYDMMNHLHGKLPTDHLQEEYPKDGQSHLTLTPLNHTKTSAAIHEEPTPVHTDEVHVKESEAEMVPHPHPYAQSGVQDPLMRVFGHLNTMSRQITGAGQEGTSA